MGQETPNYTLTDINCTLANTLSYDVLYCMNNFLLLRKILFFKNIVAKIM